MKESLGKNIDEVTGSKPGSFKKLLKEMKGDPDGYIMECSIPKKFCIMTEDPASGITFHSYEGSFFNLREHIRTFYSANDKIKVYCLTDITEKIFPQ